MAAALVMYSEMAYQDLPEGTLFVSAPAGTDTRASRELAFSRSPHKWAKFDGGSYLYYGNPGIDANVLSFVANRPDEKVINGPHITTMRKLRGVICDGGLILLEKLFKSPGLGLMRHEIPAPTLWRFAVLRRDSAQRALDAVIHDLSHVRELIRVNGQYIVLTIPGLNRALQEGYTRP